MSYTSFIKTSEGIRPIEGEVLTFKNLTPGTYIINIKNSQSGPYLVLQESKFNTDKILDIPSKEYELVTSEMQKFLSDEVRQKYENLGYLYKRSTLLYGLPGTGKTIITSRVAKDVVSRGGVVFLIKEAAAYCATGIVKAMLEISPETLVLVILEEIDAHLRPQEETEFLNLFDGQIQRPNTMYLATTNFIEKIPPRLMRPGRMSSVIEIKYPDAVARDFYLNNKLGKDYDKSLLEKSEGLSIDSLKELILSTQILGQDIDNTVKRLLETQTEYALSKESEEGDDENDFAWALTNAIQRFK